MVYSDANYYLISRVIAQKSGKTLQSLAREMLFCPLTLYNATWETCPKGYAIGASGLFLTVENMAKLGVLMLHNGMWNGKQLVSEDWIRQMRQERTCTSEGRGYGYGVWLQRDTKAYTARGMQGQFIFISPQTGRIIACQSCEDDDKMDPLLDLLIQLDNEDFI